MQQQSPGHSTFKSLYKNREQISLEDFTSLLHNHARFQGADHGYCLWLSKHFQSSLTPQGYSKLQELILAIRKGLNVKKE